MHVGHARVDTGMRSHVRYCYCEAEGAADHPIIAQDARSPSPLPLLRVSSLNRAQIIVSYPPLSLSLSLSVQLHVLMFQLCYELEKNKKKTVKLKYVTPV